MFYSAIGVLALMVLLISDQDILLNRYGGLELPSWKVYRGFLFAVLIYYITDILWGFLESQKWAAALFADTFVYFIAMAAGVLLWSQYVVTYLHEKETGFGKFMVLAGRVLATVVAVLSVVNIFIPVLFSVDENCVYNALPFRYFILACQIVLLIIISINAFTVIFRKDFKKGNKKRYTAVAEFGIIMAVFLFLQMLYPYLPLYAIAYMLGTCLLRVFVIGEEKDEFRRGMEEAEKITQLKHSLSSLLDNIPALTFYKDAETGAYLACNQAFAEYAHKEKPEGVIGLTDSQIFDRETAEHFVEDDRLALSMDEPYIFFEDVHDAEGNQRQFQTTKLKFIDGLGRLCLLGMCQDVTDMVRIQRENATTKEAYEKAKSNGIIFTHIAQTLACSYEDIYYVNTESDEFIEYHTDHESGTLKEIRRGPDFFEKCRVETGMYIYPEDREMVIDALGKKNLLDAIDRNKSFVITYRLFSGDEPVYVTMKVSRMEDDERFIILCVTNVDEEVKQRKAAERMQEERMAYARISALTGDVLCAYIVDPETGRFREYSVTGGFETIGLPKEGEDFFDVSREEIVRVIDPGDLDRFLSAFTGETVVSEIRQSGIFAISYKVIFDGKPNHVQLKAAMVEEKEGKRLIVGVIDTDHQVKQEQEFAKHLAKVQKQAKIDALTGVRNKLAYLDEEKKLNRMIAEKSAPEFGIVIMDLNDLKKVNDSAGHQAGDRYIKDACRVICDTFKKSPVFRVGGDEFAVILMGEDHMNVQNLIARIESHNEEAGKSGGAIIACGLAEHENEESVAQVFERADRNMYEDKRRLKSDGDQ